jgi:enoyl-CoA hydratase/carnithine racemase
MNTTPALRVRRDGGVLRVTIDRPARHNPLSRTVLAALHDALRQGASDAGLHCVVIRGAGERYFAAGGDLHDLGSVRSEEQTAAMVLESRGALDAVRECPVPVVALVNGDALGGGAELAVACDLRVMAAHAHIGYMHGRLHVSTGWGGGTDLFDLVGRARGLRMLARAEMVTAADALGWGLADAVAAPGEDLDELAERFIAPMLELSPRLLRAFKAQSLAKRRGTARDARRESEMRDFIATWVHDDHWTAVGRILSRNQVTE